MPPHSPACHISRASQSHPLMTALPSSAPPLLAAHALTYSRNAIPILGPLHFHINPGEALIVQGPNGIGKTTLLRILAGLLHSDSGHIHIDTHHNTTAPERTRHIAYLSHLPGLKQDLSALENLHFLNALHGCQPPTDTQQRTHHRWPDRPCTDTGSATFSRPEKTPQPGPTVALTSPVMALGRTLRQPKSRGHHTPQPHPHHTPSHPRRHTAHHTRRAPHTASPHPPASLTESSMSAPIPPYPSGRPHLPSSPETCAYCGAAAPPPYTPS